MGTWVHRLTEINLVERTAVCAECGPTRVKVRGGTRASCAESERSGRRTYRRHKGSTCERCGFVPKHPCQLDVDHRDGDHSNDDPSNLQTLCANCHRLKSHLEREQRRLAPA